MQTMQNIAVEVSALRTEVDQIRKFVEDKRDIDELISNFELQIYELSYTMRELKQIYKETPLMQHECVNKKYNDALTTIHNQQKQMRSRIVLLKKVRNTMQIGINIDNQVLRILHH